MATPDEAVDAVWSLFACRCAPAWTERRLHAPDCVQELGYDVLDIVTKARADERARVLDEVDAALRDGKRYREWLEGLPLPPPDQHVPFGRERSADYLRDTVGAGGEG